MRPVALPLAAWAGNIAGPLPDLAPQEVEATSFQENCRERERERERERVRKRGRAGTLSARCKGELE